MGNGSSGWHRTHRYTLHCEHSVNGRWQARCVEVKCFCKFATIAVLSLLIDSENTNHNKVLHYTDCLCCAVRCVYVRGREMMCIVLKFVTTVRWWGGPNRRASTAWLIYSLWDVCNYIFMGFLYDDDKHHKIMSRLNERISQFHTGNNGWGWDTNQFARARKGPDKCVHVWWFCVHILEQKFIAKKWPSGVVKQARIKSSHKFSSCPASSIERWVKYFNTSRTLPAYGMK